jgi:hypothetical protein
MMNANEYTFHDIFFKLLISIINKVSNIVFEILIILFRHNNEVYHIRIYTQEVDGTVKHYLVDSLPFDSLQVRKKINFNSNSLFFFFSSL